MSYVGRLVSARTQGMVVTAVALQAFVAAAGCGSTPSGGVVPAHGDQPKWSTTAQLADVDLSTVWGAGSDIFAAGNGPKVVHSGDAGMTWTMVDTTEVAGSVTPTFHHISGSSGADVWLAGSFGESSVFLHSADHGASWQRHDIGDVAHLTAVWAFDPNQILIANNDGDILRSDDGGASWSRTVTGTRTPLLALWGSSLGYAYAVGGDAAAASSAAPGEAADHSSGCDGAAPDVDGGAVASPGGILLRSTDGGKTWASVEVAPASALWSVWGTNSGSVVYASGAHESVVHSVDGGATWVADSRTSAPLGLDDVWVGPTDGSVFLASSIGIVRDLTYNCAGPVSLAYETLPSSSGGTTGTAAVWGDSVDDVWAVGPGGAIRNRR